jgi:tRNA-Thr(GGU) m(6)t(6)A37 methyltransferase TsaA
MVTLTPIGTVRSTRRELADDFWGDQRASIELAPELPDESLDGIESFSHAEILFVFDRLDPASIVRGARHPRGNPAWPRVGIFAQRGKGRPNRLGSTIVRVVGREARSLIVEGLDAVDGTPVIDIKPVLAEFLPRSAVRQPDWARELMRDYWRPAADRPRK